ncbi:MAG: hypothetical protein HY674_22825 [Chloroflexi bacterium]|nr:hypothetical protein [Chloroflexota bacterium]
MQAFKHFGQGLLLAAGLSALTAAAQTTVNTLLTVDSSAQPEPYGVAVDPYNNNYLLTLSGEHRIVKFNPGTGLLTNFVGFPGVKGYKDGTGLVARFFSPQGIIVARGGLVVADSGNHLIRFVTWEGNVTTLAGNPDGLAKGTNGLFVPLNAPAGLAADAAGNVYIADVVNTNLLKLDVNNEVSVVASGFDKPAAVAVDNTGRIFVADARRHSIKMIVPGSSTATLLAGSDSPILSGADDNIEATLALFDSPRGLLWVGGNTGLLVSDSGNHIIRKVFLNQAFNVYSVQTIEDTRFANMRTPVGLALDLSRNVLVVDLDKRELRGIPLGSSTVQQPKVSDPIIGTVTLTNDFFVGTHMTPVTNATFNNDVVVAILSEEGTVTRYIKGPSDTITPSQIPGPSDFVADAYRDGMSTMPVNIVAPIIPDITIKAIGTQEDRPPSAVITARFRFQVANPVVVGNNAASFSLRTATLDAEMWYTTDDTDPLTNGPPALRYVPDTQLNVAQPTNVVFKVRGFKKGYFPSQITRQVFLTNEVQFNTIGVPRSFRAGVGATVVIPVEARLADNQEIRSLSFRVEISPNATNGLALNGTNTPGIRVLPVSANDFIPVNFPGGTTPNVIPYQLRDDSGTTGLLTNGVGIAYLGTNAAFRIVDSATVAMLAVRIPPDARTNEVYRISVLHPSATSDGVLNPVLLTTLDSQTITITNVSYIVGDTASNAAGKRWYNAGEFGNGDLDVIDVNNAFFASLGFNVPYRFTDVFNAMDVFPEDGLGAVGGDGQIRFLDWQILLRRSWRLDRTNWVRAWSSQGVLESARGGLPLLAAQSLSSQGAGGSPIAWTRVTRMGALPQDRAQPGLEVAVPIYLEADAGVGISGMQFLAFVVPEGNAPALTKPVKFVPAAGFQSVKTDNTVPELGVVTNAVYAAWSIGALEADLHGSNVLGQVQFTVPVTASTGQWYTVYFANADGASQTAGGYTQYDFESFRASIWVGTGAQAPPERLPDEWKQYFFGSLTDPMAQAEADGDGDGAANWTEYRDKTHPKVNDFRFQAGDVRWRAEGGVSTFKLSWFAASGKRYLLESAADLSGTNWTPIAGEMAGSGQVKEFIHTNSISGSQFYRVRIAP